MKTDDYGRPIVAALFICLAAAAASAKSGPAMVVETSQGAILGKLGFDEGQEICLSWAHSVSGGDVQDCFENRRGEMVLTRSYLHDFAAGLGDIAGRGALEPAEGGGYWITGIDEAIPQSGLLLRVGAPRVGHVLRSASQSLDLSAIAPGARVTLRLAPDMPQAATD